MSIQIALRAAPLLLLATAVSMAQLPSVEGERPNLVIILADDLGFGDPHCYNPRSKIPTPEIDRLAAQGRCFTDAHTPSSVCSPTRYGLLTGRYAWRTRLNKGVLGPWAPPLIAAQRLTLAGMVRRLGYRTACIGKWHLGWSWPAGCRRGESAAFAQALRGGPTERGFEHYFGDGVPNYPPYCFIEDAHVQGVPSALKPKGMFGNPGPMVPGWKLSAVLPALARAAAAWLTARCAEERPFFLYLALTAPHTPIAPLEEFHGKSAAGRYGDYVCQVDHVLGQVLEALERGGATGRTLVIFTSDNGSPARDGTKMSGPVGSVRRRFGHDPSRPWRGLKGDIWEGGHRVPLIARWPGRVPAGTSSAEPICLVDLFATTAELLGWKLPAGVAEDSFACSALLLGEKGALSPRDHLIHHAFDGTFAIRAGRWKLIADNLGSGGFTRPRRILPKGDQPRGQLYDLVEDPAEKNNRYRQHPEIAERLRARLERYRRQDHTRAMD